MIEPEVDATDPDGMVRRAISLATAVLPHLGGLAAILDVTVDDRVPTAGVFASGRLVVNPDWFRQLDPHHRAFVLAHEMLHLALGSHARGQGANRQAFNWAHDAVINDMLRHEFGFTEIPASGVDVPGARDQSAEQLLVEAAERGGGSQPGWQSLGGRKPGGSLGSALTAAGLGREMAEGPVEGTHSDDLMDDGEERRLFPGESETERLERKQRAAEEGRRALDLQALGERLRSHERGNDAGGATVAIEAQAATWKAPWELAIQPWLDGVTAGTRTYSRASRRAGTRKDVVLPGRRHDSFMIHLLLDTSGSMSGALPEIFGALGTFCEAAGIDAIRVIEADTEVQADRIVTPTDLAAYEVHGMGGSDLCPAFAHLADDPEVEAVIVITDGAVEVPVEAPRFAVLWTLVDGWDGFSPNYGRVVKVS